MTTLENRPTAPDLDGPEHQAELVEPYRDFDAVGVPHLWRWSELYPLAARSGLGECRNTCVAEKTP
jgi:gentisate 1,2-dioxygenase